MPRLIAFDTETELVSPGNLAPALACLSYCESGEEPQLLHHSVAAGFFAHWLRERATLVGHNVAFDMAVMSAHDPTLLPLIFRAYDDGRVHDTMVTEQLRDIRHGTFHGGNAPGLDLLCKSYLVRDMSKGADTWRLRYGELRPYPLEEWPEDAKAYALLDALTTLQVHQAQHSEANETEQTRYAFWLYLMSAWGICTDPAKVHLLEQETTKERDRVAAMLLEAGLLRWGGTKKAPKLTRDTKAAQERMRAVWPHGEPKATPSGGLCLDSDACEQSGDPLLESYSDYSSLAKVLSTDVPIQKQPVVQTRYGLAATGRTTSSKPNIQNLRRMPGIRESYVPRPGTVFIDADYNALELYSLAQALLDMFRESELAKVLQAGKDPHTMLAGDILEIPYDVAAKRKKDKQDKEFDNARQTAKVANFGLPGGLGPDKLVWFARKTYQVTLTVERARELKAQWLARWPEMVAYFAHWGRVTANVDGKGSIELPRSGRIRGETYFCNLCNTRFQGPASDAAKEAGWLIAKACYVDTSSVLYGCRPVAFIHDQWLIECPEDGREHDAALEVVRLMQDGARVYLPDCVPPVEPLLCRYWSKEAAPVYRDGRLVAWPV